MEELSEALRVYITNEMKTALSDELKNIITEIVRTEISKIIQKEEYLPQLEFIGLGDVCLLTGYKAPTIYSLVYKKSIPFYKNKTNGRKLLFRRSEIIEWMASRKN